MALYFIPKYINTDKNFPVVDGTDVSDLNNLNSLSEQVKRLTALLEISPEELDKRKAACEEVLQILRKFYPDSSLLMYGPSANSFGIKGCDIDLLFMPFPNYSNLDSMEDEAEEVIPDPESVSTGKVSNDVLAKLKEPSHLKFIRTVFRSEKISKRANIFILHKRLLLRVILKNNNFICAISASNKLVAFNSELLQFYGKLDERVKPLVVCLQFWARSLGFIKKTFFSWDAFTWLVIFFLQSVNVLPSVQHLMRISGFSRMMAGWETAFCTDVRRAPKSKNTQTVGELFAQFFDFYFHFDFSQNVVSPHSGRALPIKDVRNSKDARMAEFQIKPMNIQDVFILNSNVSTVEKLAVFKLALLTAKEMLKDTGRVKLPAFFNPDAYQRVLDIHYNKYIGYYKPFFCFIHLDYNCIQKMGSLQMWYDKASEAVYDVLQYGLLMECEVTDKVNSIMKNRTDSVNGNSKHDSSVNKGRSMHPVKNEKNVETSTSTPYDLQLLISIQCLMYSRVYEGRKKVEVAALDSSNDFELHADSVLGVEHCISKSVLDRNSSLKSSVPFLVFNCECYKHANPELTDLIVMIKPLVFSKSFYQVSQFLSAFLSETVKKILTSN